MKKSMLAIGLLVLLLSAGVAVTQEIHKTYSVSTEAFRAPTRILSPLVSETFGFESGEGFASGFIGGQAGWTTFSSSAVEGHIDTVNPATGTQHFRISGDSAVSAGDYTGGFSPEVADTVEDACYVEVDVFISAVGGADYDVVPQSTTQGQITARVKFEYQGNIQIYDDTGSGVVFVDTGIQWTVGSYVTLGIYIDPIAGTIDYYYGGSLIYSSAGGVFAGSIVEQVVLLSDNYQAGDSGDFDNLVIERGEVPVQLLSFNIE